MAVANELTINTSVTALDMAQTIFGAGVQVLSASYTGVATSAGIYSGALTTLTGDNAAYPVISPTDSGVILSTGNAADITNSDGSTNTNQVANRTTDTAGVDGDAQLNAVAGQNTFDGAILTATFIPDGDFMTMQFVFSSEEYPEYVGDIYNDAFGVWINDTFVPISVTPQGEVAINSVNSNANENLYNDNTLDQYNTEMDGFTFVLSMKAPVNKGVVNTIRIAIADAGDATFDSNLLIMANSIQTGTLAFDDTINTLAGSTRTFDVLANDSDGAGLGLTITQINGTNVVAGQSVTLETGETITLNLDGTLTVTATTTLGYNAFSYTIVDANGNTDVGYLQINTVAAQTLDGIVQGTSGSDVINGAYVGDPDGDMVDANDALGVLGTFANGDVIHAGDGNDSVAAGEGADIVLGGDGDDTIDGGNGNDTVDGGLGADSMLGGAGTDTLTYANSGASVTVNLATGAGSGGYAQGDTFSGFENVIGSIQADTITGDAQANTIDAGGGNDTVQGGAGADSMIGGAGIDTLDYSASSAAVTVNLATGAASGGDAAGDTFSSFENLIGSAQNDSLTGDAQANTIDAGGGNDTVQGGAGADSMQGGGGFDTLSYASSTAAVTVNLLAGTASGGDAAGDIFASFENLTGSTGNDSLTGDGDANTIDAGAGNDTVEGGAGADSMLGGAGNDTLSYSGSSSAVTVSLAAGTGSGGDAQGDTFSSFENLTGSAHNDSLTGSSGANTITGGGGDDQIQVGAADGQNDVVVLTAGGGHDTVFGFEAPVDLGGGNYSGRDQLDVFGLTDAGGLPVNVSDVTVTDDGSGNALLTFPNGESVTLVGISPVTAANVNYLAALGIPPAGAVIGTTGDDVMGIGYVDVQGNTIDGADGNNDVILAGGGDDTVQGGLGFDSMVGGSGTDTLSYAGSNVGVTVSLATGTGSGGHAAGDTFSGFENLTGSGFNDSLTGDGNANVISGGAGNDTINGGDGDDTIVGGAGGDTLTGGNGSDTVSYAGSSAGVIVNIATNAVSGGDAASDVISGFENIIGSSNADSLTGSSGDNTISAGDGNDSVQGGAGADSMDGGAGTDLLTYAASAAGVTVSLATGTGSGGDAAGDTFNNFENLTGSAQADSLTGDANANTIDGGAGNDTIEGGAGADSLNGNTGTDTLSYAGSYAGVTVNLATNAASGGHAQGDTITAFENVTGSIHDDSLIGTTAANTILGGDGNDTIQGGAGADSLQGGAGIDTLSYAGSAAVSVNLATGVVSGGDAASDVIGGFEDILGSSNGDTLTGDASVNQIDGGAGNDTVEGGAGGDSMIGGAGTDTLSYAGSSAAVTVDLGNLIASGGDATGDSFTGFENLTGSANADSLAGDSGANTINGGDGNDTIQGGGGADSLIGGLGTDTLSYANAGSGITLNLATSSGSGGDAAGDTFTGFEVYQGSAFNDTFTGSAAADSIRGGAGADVITGAGGNDSIDVGAADGETDTIVIGNGAGSDTIYGFEAPTDLGGGVYAGRDRLDVSTLIDGGGQPVNTADVTVSNDGSGNARLTFPNGESVTLIGIDPVLAANVNYLIALGIPPAGAVNGTSGNDTMNIGFVDAQGDTIDGADGNADVIFAADGNDTVEGGLGADFIDGGTGTDTLSYANSSAGVTINLATGLGSGGHAEGDVVSNFENVTGSTHSDSITGSGQANTITGGNGDDTIDAEDGNDLIVGGQGADSMDGGAGTDTLTYAASAAGVTVNLLTGTGSGGDAAGDQYANIEIVTGSGSADSITGDANANTIDGGLGDDTIEGGAGADSLNGNTGTDTLSYAGSSEGVTVNIATNVVSGGDAQGDTITSFENVIGSTHNDSITGTTSANTILAGDGDDTVLGGAGADSLSGGAGIDTLSYAGSAAVTVNLATNSATGGDATGDAIAGFENVIGTANADSITGSAADNTIDAGGGNDTVEGGAGADYMIGGAGTDTLSYTNSSAGVTVNLLTGTGSGGDADGDIFNTFENLTGSANADSLTGNAGANVINGGAGADTIDGGAGNDTIDVGAADNAVDIIVIGAGGGLDTANGFEGPIALGGGAFSGRDQLNVSGLTDAGGNAVNVNDVTVTGTTNAVLTFPNGERITLNGVAVPTVANIPAWLIAMGIPPAGIVDGTAGSDTMGIGFVDVHGETIDGADGNPDTIYGYGGDDTIEGGAGADSMDGGADADTLSYANSGSAVTVSLASGTGSGGDAAGDSFVNFENLTGSAQNDSLTGNGVANTILGGNGNDTIDAGAGNDFVEGGAGADSMLGGADIDTLSYASSDAGVTVSLASGSGSGGHATGDSFSGFENVTGSAHADSLTGSSGVNTILAGAGTDTVEGGAGADSMDGGADIDTLSYANSSAGVTVDLGAGTASGGDAAGDTFTNFENLTGSAQADSLTGSGDANTISAGAGADTVNGGAGNDLIAVGAGDGTNDTVVIGNGAGQDIVTGFEAPTDLGGGAFSGNDRLDVSGLVDADGYPVNVADVTVSDDGSGNAVLTFPNGEAVTLVGIAPGAAAATAYLVALGIPAVGPVDGTAGNDTIGAGYIDTGGDMVDGTDGDDDTILAGAGNDTVEGGAGADSMDGGADADTLSYAGSAAGVTVNLGAGTASGGDATGDSFVNFENLAGSAQADSLTGSGDANTISAGAGADTVDGGAGDDVIHVGAGDGAVDVVVIGNGAGNDIVHGFAAPTDLGGGVYAGNDQLDVSTLVDADGYPVNVADVAASIDGDGNLVLAFPNGETVTLVGVPMVIGSWQNYLQAMGIPAVGPVDGTAANDSIGAGYIDAGGDMVDGTDGDDDTILAGGGNDTVEGGAGADSMDGGADIDTLSYANSSAGVTVDLGAGTASGGDADGDSFVNFENLTGSANGDSLTGSTSDNTLLAGAGNDTVEGGAGADSMDGGADIDTLSYLNSAAGVTVDLGAGTGSGGDADGDTFTSFENLTGSAQADSLTGSSGANTILAGDGADTVDGGAGDDTLDLGAADGDDDVIVVANGSGNDTILNFETPLDLGGGVFQVRDRLDVSTLVDADGFPVNVADVTVGDDGSGNAVLSFPNGESLTLVGVTPAEATGPGFLVMLGVPAVGPVDGTAGDDVMGPSFLDSNGDSIDGLDGDDDTIFGFVGNDVIEGGAGADSMDGGADVDTLSYAGSAAGVTVNLGTGTASGGDADGDSFVNFENLTGSAQADSLTGSSGDNTINAGDGEDTVEGGAGADSMNGGVGTDTLSYAGSAAGVTVDLGTGTASGGDADGDTFTSFENLTGSAQADSLTGDGNANTISAGAGADTVDAGAGDDTVNVGAADGAVDTVIVGNGSGNDTVLGFEAPTDLGGGAWSGNDQIDVSGLVDAGGNPVNVADVTVSDDGSGNAVLTFPNGESVTLAGVSPVDAADWNFLIAMGIPQPSPVDGTSGNDVMSFVSGGFIDIHDDTIDGADGNNDSILGYGGDDTIEGGLGADSIDGGADNDTLSYANSDAGVTVSLTAGLGTGGHAEGDTFVNFENILGSGHTDTLTGDAGINTITGGLAADRMFGLNGDDTFVVRAADVVPGETIDGGADTDTIAIRDGGTVSLVGVTVTSIERIVSDSADTRLVLANNALATTVVAMDGAADAVEIGTWIGGSYVLSDLFSLTDAGAERVEWTQSAHDFVAEQIGGNIRITATDIDGDAISKPYTDIVHVWDRAERLVQQVTYHDDLTVTTTDYDTNGLVSARLIDATNAARTFQTSAYTYVDGKVSTYTIVTNDGAETVKTYDTSGPTSVLVDSVRTDVANAYSYATVTETWDASGMLTSRDTVYDSGTMARMLMTWDSGGGSYRAITFVDGRLSEAFMVGGIIDFTRTTAASGSMTVVGGDGNNTLSGGALNDVFKGGAGFDVFEFSGTVGADRVIDFTDGVDRLDLTDYGITDMASLGSAARQHLSTVIIDLGASGSVTLHNFNLAQLDDSDFF